MSVAGENVSNSQVLHDDHRREIDEGNIRLVVVFLAQFPGAAELLRGNVDEEVLTRIRACQVSLKT